MFMGDLGPLVGGDRGTDVGEILNLNEEPLAGAGFLPQFDRTGAVGSSGVEVKNCPILIIK